MNDLGLPYHITRHWRLGLRDLHPAVLSLPALVGLFNALSAAQVGHIDSVLSFIDKADHLFGCEQTFLHGLPPWAGWQDVTGGRLLLVYGHLEQIFISGQDFFSIKILTGKIPPPLSQELAFFRVIFEGY